MFQFLRGIVLIGVIISSDGVVFGQINDRKAAEIVARMDDGDQADPSSALLPKRLLWASTLVVEVKLCGLP